MDFDSIVAWFKTPAGMAVAAQAALLLSALFHKLGWNVPIFSTLVNKIPTVGGAATVPVAAPVGGQQAPAALNPTSVAAAQAHPLFNALTQVLAKRQGLPASHPFIQAAAKAAIADAPTFLSLLAEAAPLVVAAGS